MTRLPVLYDPDCGFCRVTLAAILRWDTRGRLRPVALGSEEADALLHGMPEEERMASWHLVAAGAAHEPGTVHSAGAAFPPVFAALPGGRPLARLTERFPRATEGVYRWVADHRSLFGRALPAASRRWADRVISGSRPYGR
jgi:predicted DCC family thiol-disulfide oxidoreductase YuxK